MIVQHEFPNGLILVAETMPSVQSAAFTLLLPAGAAYEPGDEGGAATMLAEWISRGAGERDSHELLTALDNLGVSHGESAQTLHTSLAAATLGRNLVPALELFADVVLRPHLDDAEVEPIRALTLQSLRSLEDDPGTKVIYELRRRRSSAAIRRPASSPRSARSAGCATRSTPATRASATGPRSSATPAPPPTAPSRPSTSPWPRSPGSPERGSPPRSSRRCAPA